MPVSPDAVLSILGFAHELAVTGSGRLKKPKKQHVPYHDEQNSELVETFKLIVKLQEKFSELNPEDREKFSLTIDQTIKLLDPDAKCSPKQIQELIDKIKEANRLDADKALQEREAALILEMVREDLLDLTQAQARKFKSKKFKLADVEEFYSDLIQACKPLERLSPTIHSTLMADIAKDVIDLKADMDKQVQMKSDATLKRHQDLEWRYKWASRATFVLGVAASIIGAITMFTIDGGALFAVGCVVLTAHKAFKHQTKVHDEEAKKIKGRLLGAADHKAADVFDPVNAFLKKLTTRSDEVYKRSKL
jgi:hypothetical protein